MLIFDPSTSGWKLCPPYYRPSLRDGGQHHWISNMPIFMYPYMPTIRCSCSLFTRTSPTSFSAFPLASPWHPVFSPESPRCLAAAALRRQHVRLYIYLDDWLIVGPSRAATLQALSKTIQLTLELGFIINAEKSSLIPSQNPVFLGASLDMTSGRATPSIDRCTALEECVHLFLSSASLPARVWLRLLGFMTSLVDIVPWCRMHMRHGAGCICAMVQDAYAPTPTSLALPLSSSEGYHYQAGPGKRHDPVSSQMVAFTSEPSVRYAIPTTLSIGHSNHGRIGVWLGCSPRRHFPCGNLVPSGATFWPRRAWFPRLMDLLVHPPLVLPKRPDLLTQLISKAPHPDPDSLYLSAWMLSKCPSEWQAFLTQLQPWQQRAEELPQERLMTIDYSTTSNGVPRKLSIPILHL